MKKTIIGILSAIIVFLGGGYAANQYLGDNLGGGRISSCRIAGYSATTSPVYLEPTTSSTTDNFVTSVNLECDIAGAEQGRLNLDVVASSSAVINWVRYYSNDGIDWFAEGTASTSADTTTHSVTYNTESWIPTAGSHQKKSIFLDEDNFTSEKLKYTFTVTGASTTLYAILEKKY